jgi:hypothetical protein
MQGEMVGAYAMYGRDKKYIQGLWGNLKESSSLKAYEELEPKCSLLSGVTVDTEGT